MSLDDISTARLIGIHPLLARSIHSLADQMLLENPPIQIRVTQALRTWNQQASLYDQGRSAPGKVVTNAPAGHSYHQFGLAVDLVPFSSENLPDWNTSHPIWLRLIQIGTSLGLKAGATFRSFPDCPHFQLTGSLPDSPDDEVRQTFKDGGIISVWRQAFPDFSV